jgi:hypothetical protein
MESWRSYLEEQSQPRDALTRMKKRSARSSWEQARAAADPESHEYSYSGIAPGKTDPLKAYHDMHQDELLGQLKLYAGVAAPAAGSLLLMLLPAAPPAAASAGGSWNIPTWMSHEAHWMLRWFHPHPSMQEVIRRVAGWLGRVGVGRDKAFQALFMGYTLPITTLKVETVLALLAMHGWVPKNTSIIKLIESWVRGDEEVAQTARKIFTEMISDGSTPEEILKFLDDHQRFLELVSVIDSNGDGNISQTEIENVKSPQ